MIKDIGWRTEHGGQIMFNSVADLYASCSDSNFTSFMTIYVQFVNSSFVPGSSFQRMFSEVSLGLCPKIFPHEMDSSALRPQVCSILF